MEYVKVVTVFIVTFVFNAECQQIKDIFVKTAGITVTHTRINIKTCSYQCHEISNEMITFDIILPIKEECPETLDPELTVSDIMLQDHPCNPQVCSLPLAETLKR